MFESLRARLAKWLQPSAEPTVARRIHRIEKDLHALTEQHEQVFRQLRLLQLGLDGVVRAAYINASKLPYPERLTASESSRRHRSDSCTGSPPSARRFAAMKRE